MLILGNQNEIMFMIKAVIYARYSSSSQTEQNIEGQVRVCREFTETAAKKEQPEHKGSDCYHLAESEGFEPSRAFRRLHP